VPNIDSLYITIRANPDVVAMINRLLEEWEAGLLSEEACRAKILPELDRVIIYGENGNVVTD
jgi:hypothetical protein